MSITADFTSLDILPDDPDELFEDLGTVGTGNYGSVVKARNRQTNEIVAIKRILLADQSAVEAVLKEIAILRKSSHPNVVRYLGAYTSLGTLWIVMEYCEGGSVDLLYRILHRPLPEKLIAYVCRHVLLGLAYLHECHRLHRDIKGGNILITRDGEVKLADFGVSTELSYTFSRRNTFIGTVLWMAPETILESDYDDRADVWSLGITVIEMAENGPPHSGLHPARAIFAIPREDPPTLQESEKWSPQMNVFIKRLLTKDKHTRPTASMMLQDPFVQVESIGTAEQMQDIIKEVIERRESMSSGRLLRGDFSSHLSTATFVEWSAHGEQTRSGDAPRPGRAREGDANNPQDSASPLAASHSPKKPYDAAPTAVEAVQLPFFTDGTLLQLPLLSAQDLSFDELCGGFHSSMKGEGSSGVPLPEFAAMLEPSKKGDGTGRMETVDAQVPSTVMQVTRTLETAFIYNHRLPDERFLTREEAATAVAKQTKFATALRTIYRIRPSRMERRGE